MSIRGRQQTGRASTPGGWSHSCERPTSRSSPSSAATISVVLGSSETIRRPLIDRGSGDESGSQSVADQLSFGTTTGTGFSSGNRASELNAIGVKTAVAITELRKNGSAIS